MQLTINRDIRVKRHALTLDPVSGTFDEGALIAVSGGGSGTVVSYAAGELVVDELTPGFDLEDTVSWASGNGTIIAITTTYPVTSAAEVAVVTIDENTVLEREIMGVDKITARIRVDQKLDLLVDDYITYDTRRYNIKAVPEGNKYSGIEFEYLIELYGETYLLYDKLFMDEGVSRFSYSGTPLEFINLILDNLQTIDLSWTLGTVSALADVKTLTFEDQSCRTALTQIAEAFELEWYIEGKEINLVDELGSVLDAQFLYGRGAALYELKRTSVDESFGTVWYGFGGTANLPETYRDNLGRLSFDENPVSYNEQIYGRKEAVVTFEDVYPKRTGTVTSTPDPTTIVDTSIDFDLNDQILVEGAARIVFVSGDLIGNEFVIRSYDHATKTITFNTNEEESGYILPNATVKPAVNDDYTLVGISMPESYVDAAEALLKSKTIEHAEANSSPKVSYELSINERFIRANELEGLINPGDKVRVIDADLGVDAEIRIQAVTHPLVNPAKLELEISDSTLYTVQERIVKDLRGVQSRVSTNQAALVYSRRLADEIRQAAILNEFKKTYVGDLAVLTGAFVAGNPDLGAVAGVAGDGVDAESIRFWAGLGFDDRASAPFRVKQNGEVYASGLEMAAGSILTIFQVLADGLSILAQGGDPEALLKRGKISDKSMSIWGEGDEIYDYTVQHSGASTEMHILSCFEGILKTGSNPTYPDVRAAITGMIEDQIADSVLYGQLVGGLNRKYGGLFSSLRNLGAKYEAMRKSSSSTIQMTMNDYQIVAEPGCTLVKFPDQPDNGYTCEIKNRTSGSLNIQAPQPTSDKIISLSNSEETTGFTINQGFNVKFRYYNPSRRWYQLNRGS